MVNINIETADVMDFECDVLVLKHAQGFFGADAAVASALIQRRTAEIHPKPGKHVLVKSNGAVAAPVVLFLGVARLGDFDYLDVREFSARALQVIGKEVPTARHVGMTIHGVNFTLDERESFLAQLGGIADAETAGTDIKRISIVERNLGRASRLEVILRDARSTRRDPGDISAMPQRPGLVSAGAASRTKPHIFVAMPFSKELEDVYVFGIQGPVNGAGYLCERTDMAAFTGDILARIKSRIETARLVIADMSGSNPNVYLEVGYAWGKSRPTLLLARKGDLLGFDVRGHRCIEYENIVDLANKLRDDLSKLELA